MGGIVLAIVHTKSHLRKIVLLGGRHRVLEVQQLAVIEAGQGIEGSDSALIAVVVPLGMVAWFLESLVFTEYQLD